MKKLEYLELSTVDSTHLFAKREAASFSKKTLTCITAKEQTSGQGRYPSRAWISPKESNLYLTIYFTLPPDFPILANLCQVLAISCFSLLKTLGLTPTLKWPNDILIQGKKIAGVLCDLSSCPTMTEVFLSIGLNVNETPSLSHTTSIYEESKKKHELSTICKQLTRQFQLDILLLEQYGFAIFHETYQRNLIYQKQTFTHSGTSFTGFLEKIINNGSAEVRLESGELVTIYS